MRAVFNLGGHEHDFDFSQHSISDSQKVPPKVLQSLRSTGDKEKIPGLNIFLLRFKKFEFNLLILIFFCC